MPNGLTFYLCFGKNAGIRLEREGLVIFRVVLFFVSFTILKTDVEVLIDKLIDVASKKKQEKVTHAQLSESCPFCGGEDLETRELMTEDKPSIPYAFSVFCRDCHSHGPSNSSIGWFESEQEAEDAWKHRS